MGAEANPNQLPEKNENSSNQVNEESISKLFNELDDLAKKVGDDKTLSEIIKDKDGIIDGTSIDQDGDKDFDIYDYDSKEEKEKIKLLLKAKTVENLYKWIKEGNEKIDEELSKRIKSEINATEKVISETELQPLEKINSQNELNSKIEEHKKNSQDFNSYYSENISEIHTETEACKSFRIVVSAIQKESIGNSQILLEEKNTYITKLNDIYVGGKNSKKHYDTIQKKSGEFNEKESLIQESYTTVASLISHSDKINSGTNLELLSLSSKKQGFDMLAGKTQNNIQTIQEQIPQVQAAFESASTKINELGLNIESVTESIHNIKTSLQTNPGNKQLTKLLSSLVGSKKSLILQKSATADTRKKYKDIQSKLNQKIYLLTKNLSEQTNKSKEVKLKLKNLKKSFFEKIKNLRLEINVEQKKIASLFEVQKGISEKIGIGIGKIKKYNETLKGREKEVLEIKRKAIKSFKPFKSNKKVSVAYKKLIELIHDSASDGEIGDKRQGFFSWKESEIKNIKDAQKKFNKLILKDENVKKADYIQSLYKNLDIEIIDAVDEYVEGKNYKEVTQVGKLIDIFKEITEKYEGLNIKLVNSPSYNKLKRSLINSLLQTNMFDDIGSALKKTMYNFSESSDKKIVSRFEGTGIGNWAGEKLDGKDKHIIRTKLHNIKKLFQELNQKKNTLSDSQKNAFKIAEEYKFSIDMNIDEYIQSITKKNSGNVTRKNIKDISEIEVGLEAFLESVKNQDNKAANGIIEHFKPKKLLSEEISQLKKSINGLKLQHRNNDLNLQIKEYIEENSLEKGVNISKYDFKELQEKRNQLVGLSKVLEIYNQWLLQNKKENNGSISSGKNEEILSYLTDNIISTNAIGNYTIQQFRLEMIKIGAGNETVQKNISSIEIEIQNKLEEDSYIFATSIKSFQNLTTLKKDHPLLYLKIIGKINLGTASTIEQNLELWEEMLSNENSMSLLRSDSFEELYSKQLKKQVETAELEILSLNDASNIINNTLGTEKYGNIKLQYNKNASQEYKVGAMQMISLMKTEGKLNNEIQQIISFANRYKAFGDVRIMQYLRVKNGKPIEEIINETSTQLEIEAKYSTGDSSHTYRVDQYYEVYLLNNKEGSKTLNSEIKLSTFQEAIKNSIEKKKLESFVTQNSKLIFAYLDYANSSTKMIDEKTKRTIGKFVYKLEKGGNDIKSEINVMAGKVDFLQVLKNQYGDIGKNIYINNLVKNLLSSDNLKDEITELSEKEKNDVLERINILKQSGDISEKEKLNMIFLYKQLDIDSEEGQEAIKELEKSLDLVENIGHAINDLIKNQNSVGRQLKKEIFISKEKLTSFKIDLRKLIKNKPISLENIGKKLIQVLGKERATKVGTKLVELKLNQATILNSNITKLISAAAITDKKKGGPNSSKIEDISKSHHKANNILTRNRNITTVAINETPKGKNPLTKEAQEAALGSYDYLKKNENLEERIKQSKANSNIIFNPNSSLEDVKKAAQEINLGATEDNLTSSLGVIATIKDLESSGEVFSKQTTEFFKKSSPKIINDALDFAKKNPGNSKQIRKDLKKVELSLKQSSNLSQKEKNALKIVQSYDLTKSEMPLKVNIDEAKGKLINSGNESKNLQINGKDYVGHYDSITGSTALLEKESGNLVILSSGGIEEALILNSSEKSLLQNNPEGLGGFAQFRNTIREANILNLWDRRSSILNGLSNVHGVKFKLGSDYLGKEEIMIFLDSILISVGEQPSQGINLDQTLLHFREKNFSTGGATDKEDANIDGDSTITEMFIKKFMPKEKNGLFDTAKFQESIKTNAK